jgi:hypothetical protein
VREVILSLLHNSFNRFRFKELCSHILSDIRKDALSTSAILAITLFKRHRFGMISNSLFQRQFGSILLNLQFAN